MKRHLELTLLCVIVSAFMLSCNKPESKKKPPGYDFRQVRWGMSIAEVKAAEESALIKRIESSRSNDLPLAMMSDFALEYKGNLFDMDCSIFYGFVGNKLVSASYNIITPNSLFVYFQLKELLAVKFKSLEKEKYHFKEEKSDTYKVNRAIFENEKTSLVLTAVYPENFTEIPGPEVKKSYVNVGYESKGFTRQLSTIKE